MQDSKPNQTHAKVRGRRRRIFTGGVAVVGSAGLAAAVLLPAGPALAAYQAGTPSLGSSVASVTVGSAIALTINTPTFTLGTGVPGDSLLTTPATVTMNVYTNNRTGYSVTVQAVTDMTDASATTDTIPAADLSVEDADANNTATDFAAYVPISAATTLGAVPLVAYSQSTRSAAGAGTTGDLLTESWRFNTPVPNVNTGTYSTTLDFIASNNVGGA